MLDLTPNLEPYKAFHEADELEAQIKALTVDVVRDCLRTEERDLNVYGAPHLGSFGLIENWVKSDGLAMNRNNSEDAMRYLHRAWRARNPKRGLHFLRTYLQLLWPQAWEMDQLWQKKSQPYPRALFTKDQLKSLGVADPRRDYFLTSRINVDVAASDSSGSGLLQVSQSLRHVVSAKFLVNFRLLRKGNLTFRVGSVFSAANCLVSSGSLQPYQISNTATAVNVGATFAAGQIVQSSGRLVP